MNDIFKILYSVGFAISVIAWVLNFYRSIKGTQDTLPMWISLAFIWIFNILCRIS